MIDHYDWAGGREAMLRFGPVDGPVVVFAQPLFEEANRTRALIVTIGRTLARRGIASVLPDLPGTGESLTPVNAARLAHWRAAFETFGHVHAVSLRGGALVPGTAVASHWQLAPLDGPALLRELERLRTAGDGATIAGNDVSDAFLTELVEAHPTPHVATRVVRLESDPKPADLKLPGTPLWRRAEPDNDPVLAEALTDDIAYWMRSCEG